MIPIWLGSSMWFIKSFPAMTHRAGDKYALSQWSFERSLPENLRRLVLLHAREMNLKEEDTIQDEDGELHLRNKRVIQILLEISPEFSRHIRDFLSGHFNHHVNVRTRTMLQFVSTLPVPPRINLPDMESLRIVSQKCHVFGKTCAQTVRSRDGFGVDYIVVDWEGDDIVGYGCDETCYLEAIGKLILLKTTKIKILFFVNQPFPNDPERWNDLVTSCNTHGINVWLEECPL